MKTIDDIFRLFELRGDSQYGGEAVTQREHALQTATLAERAQAPASLIVAALLHDIGHLLHDMPHDAPEHGIDDCHETSAGQYLRRFFPESVTEAVRLHVAAKRYLSAVEINYLEQLSVPSKVSLELQGGPMTLAQIDEFRIHPHAMDAVRLRRWDDEAKDPSLRTESFPHFAKYIREVELTGDLL